MSSKFCALAVAGFLLTAALASAQPTTVFVSPVTSNPTASGTNLLNALAGITTASSANPFVLKLDPGIYDVGVTGVQMKPYVDIEGSGQQSTIIRGPGGDATSGIYKPVVKGAAPAELRNLQVLSQGGTAISLGVWLDSCATSLRDLTIIASNGSDDTIALRTYNAGATMTNVSITVNGVSGPGTVAYGLLAFGDAGVIRHMVANVSNSSQDYGIAINGSVKEVRDVELNASAGGSNYGFYIYFTSASSVAEIDNSTINATSNNAYGIYLGGNSSTFVLSHTNVTGFSSFFGGGSSYGVWTNFISGGYLYADQSVIYGVTKSLQAPGVTAYIGSSRLSGPASAGSLHCAMSYNGSWLPLGAGCT